MHETTICLDEHELLRAGDFFATDNAIVGLLASPGAVWRIVGSVHIVGCSLRHGDLGGDVCGVLRNTDEHNLSTPAKHLQTQFGLGVYLS